MEHATGTRRNNSPALVPVADSKDVGYAEMAAIQSGPEVVNAVLPAESTDSDVRKGVVMGCSTAAIALTAVSIFVGLFLHPAVLVLLVVGNGACLTLAYKYGYRAVASEPAPPEASSRADLEPQTVAKSTDQKVQVPMIQIDPPTMVAEL